MTKQAFITSFPWARYSKKLVQKIVKPRCVGIFTPDDAKARGVHLAIGSEGEIDDENAVTLYWLVDQEDGVILDAKFQVFGQSALIGAAEAACELLVGKNYDQAKRISADIIDNHFCDQADIPAFPPETFPHLNLILGAIEMAADQCAAIPFASTYVAISAPMEGSPLLEGDGYPGWIDLTQEKKIAVIEEILTRDIRPYIALDGGGIEVLNLIDDRQLMISYQGNCTSCYSAVGATLSYIQKVLQAQVHPDLTVIPDISFDS